MAELSPPKQKRSRATLDAIAKATKELLETHTYAELTISQIVKRAGSSTGSFYARFEGKRALLHFLHESYVQSARSGIQEWVDQMAPDAFSLEDFAEIGIPHIAQSHLENRGILRATLIEAFDDVQFSVRAFELLQWMSATTADLIDPDSKQRDAFVAEIQTSLLAIIAILDQDLFYVPKVPVKTIPMSKIQRLQRIFLAAMDAERTSK